MLHAAICWIGGGPPLVTWPQPDLPRPDPGFQEVAVAKDQINPALNFHVWIPPPIHHDCGAVVQERSCMAGPGRRQCLAAFWVASDQAPALVAEQCGLQDVDTVKALAAVVPPKDHRLAATPGAQRQSVAANNCGTGW